MKKTISSILLCVMLVLSLSSGMLTAAAADALTISSISGDIKNIYFNFDKDISASTNASEKVTVTNNGESFAVTCTPSGSTLKITPESGRFEPDVTYKVSVAPGFGTDAAATADKIDIVVKNKSIFSENFDEIAGLSEKFTTNDQFYTGFASIQNGGMYYNGQIPVYPNVPDIETLDNYSVSFNYKRYGGSYDFNVMFFATEKNQTDKPGYLVNFGAIYPGHNWNRYTSGHPLNPEMLAAGTMITAGSWWTAPEFNETNPENNYDLSFVKRGTVVEAYYESNLVCSYDFAQNDVLSNGYFGFYGSEGGVRSLIDNLVFTTFESEVYEEKTAALESVSGDIQNVILTFSEDMTGTTNVSEKIIIRDGASLVPFDYNVKDNTIKLTAKNTYFEADKSYIIEIDSGIGTDTTKTEEKYIRLFKNKSIFSENFDEITSLSEKFTTNDQFYTGFASIQNGGMYYNGQIPVYPNVPDIETLDNYSVSFNYKRYGGSYDFNVMFFATEKNQTDKPGYLVNFGAIYPGHNWNRYTSGHPLNPEMLAAGTMITAGSWWTAPEFNETNPENNYDLSFVKRGTVVEAYYESNLVCSYDFAQNDVLSNGYFGFYGSEGGVQSLIDNLVFTTFESSSPSELIFGGIKVMDTKGTVEEDDDTEITTIQQLQAAFGIKGTAYVGNFSNSTKPVVIIVAMYNENNEMLSAKIAMNGTMENGISTNYPFEFDKNSEATKIRCFALDSMTNLSPYEKAVQVPNN